MKHKKVLLYLLMCIFFVSFVFAEENYWNLSERYLFPESLDYKVGIGTINPSEKLQVNGNIKLEGDLNLSGRIGDIENQNLLDKTSYENVTGLWTFVSLLIDDAIFSNMVVFDNGSVFGDNVFPKFSGTIDLGSDANLWRTVYSERISDITNNITIQQIKSAYDHSQNSSQAHLDYLLNNADDITTGKLTAEGGFSTSGSSNVEVGGYKLTDPYGLRVPVDSPVFCADADTDACLYLQGMGARGYYFTDLRGREIFTIKFDGVMALRPLATAPTTCSIGDIYVDDSGSACFCTSTNTWENAVSVGSCV